MVAEREGALHGGSRRPAPSKEVAVEIRFQIEGSPHHGSNVDGTVRRTNPTRGGATLVVAGSSR